MDSTSLIKVAASAHSVKFVPLSYVHSKPVEDGSGTMATTSAEDNFQYCLPADMVSMCLGAMRDSEFAKFVSVQYGQVSATVKIVSLQVGTNF